MAMQAIYLSKKYVFYGSQIKSIITCFSAENHSIKRHQITNPPMGPIHAELLPSTIKSISGQRQLPN